MLKDDRNLVKMDRLDVGGQVDGVTGGACRELRAPFVVPVVVHHDQLPVITAGSISQEAWGFAD